MTSPKKDTGYKALKRTSQYNFEKWGEYMKRYNQEKEKVRVLREALEFYANWGNWERGGIISKYDHIEMKGDFAYYDKQYDSEVVGGKRAREALEQTKGDEK